MLGVGAKEGWCLMLLPVDPTTSFLPQGSVPDLGRQRSNREAKAVGRVGENKQIVGKPWEAEWCSKVFQLTFVAQASWSKGGGRSRRRQGGFLGRLFLFHPGVLRRLEGAGWHWAAAVAIGAVLGAAAAAVARVAARFQAGDGLLKRRRNQCRV